MEKTKKIVVRIENIVVYEDLVQECKRKNKKVEDVKAELKRNFKKIEFVVK